MAKVLLVALVAIFALQVFGHHIQIVNDDVDDAMEEALKVLQEVRNILNNIVASSTTFVNSVTESLHSSQEKVNANTKILDKTEEQLKNLINDIDDAIEHVKDHSWDVNECIEDVEFDLINFEKSKIDTRSACNGETIGTVLQDAEQLLTNLSQITQQIDNQANVLEKCRQDLSPIDCINNVVDYLNNITASVPEDIKADINRIDTELTKVEVTVQECSDDIVPTFAEGFESLQLRFQSCLNLTKYN